MGAPSRRKVGHGMLAERALEPIFSILPSETDFPCIIRVESTITENSTSVLSFIPLPLMASFSDSTVWHQFVALHDAGVPVKGLIAGIAMGLVLDTEEFGGDGIPLILSDITGSEDASGDMDFKSLVSSQSRLVITSVEGDLSGDHRTFGSDSICIEVPTDDVRVGDSVLVLPRETIPVDSRGVVDESMLTENLFRGIKKKALQFQFWNDEIGYACVSLELSTYLPLLGIASIFMQEFEVA
ncbi:hypothetical protein IFM89_012073 [Coptis chinensis]|uniref:Uncharacterized protein n=1 Tax=Coptis chinensis TaxID=261450 RepID=A0A835LVD4_9MAGN|nr:hypothetical protein IFM89_012073 [Coptis chinensis]